MGEGDSGCVHDTKTSLVDVNTPRLDLEMQWISDNNSLNNGEFTSEDELGKQVIILICIRFKL